MSTQFVVFLLVSLCLISHLNADFVCPPGHITKDAGLSGVIPNGATAQVKVPAGTQCTYTFEIPKGFALKVVSSAFYEISPGDEIKFGTFYVDSPADKEVDFSADSVLPYYINSVTGNLTFMAEYSFIDMSNYQQVLKPTVSYFNATLELGKYYTIKASTDNDQVSLKYGSRDTGFYDWTISNVFVFDGNDLKTAEYVGRVPDLMSHRRDYYSTSNTLSLVNLYGNPSNSLFLGNDASVIENMDWYTVYVIDSDKDLNGWMGLLQDPDFKSDAYHTVICDGCDSFSIDFMLFDKKYENASGYVEIQGMTPTDRLPTMLKYPYSSSNNNSFPQLIPAPIATFRLHNATFEYLMSPGTPQKDFSAAPGETRSIYSPQQWNPSATPSFDYTFSDPLKVYNFSINLQTISLENDGDELDVQVGSVNGLTTLDKKYNKTKFANQFISGMGRFLKLKYTGAKTSEVILNFKMIDPSNPDGTTQNPGTDGTTVSSALLTSSSPITSVSTRATRVSTSTAPTVAKSTVTSTVVPMTNFPSTSQSTLTTTLSPSPSTIMMPSSSSTNVSSTTSMGQSSTNAPTSTTTDDISISRVSSTQSTTSAVPSSSTTLVKSTLPSSTTASIAPILSTSSIAPSTTFATIKPEDTTTQSSTTFESITTIAPETTSKSKTTLMVTKVVSSTIAFTTTMQHTSTLPSTTPSPIPSSSTTRKSIRSTVEDTTIAPETSTIISTATTRTTSTETSTTSTSRTSSSSIIPSTSTIPVVETTTANVINTASTTILVPTTSLLLTSSTATTTPILVSSVSTTIMPQATLTTEPLPKSTAEQVPSTTEVTTTSSAIPSTQKSSTLTTTSTQSTNPTALSDSTERPSSTSLKTTTLQSTSTTSAPLATTSRVFMTSKPTTTEEGSTQKKTTKMYSTSVSSSSKQLTSSSMFTSSAIPITTTGIQRSLSTVVTTVSSLKPEVASTVQPTTQSPIISTLAPSTTIRAIRTQSTSSPDLSTVHSNNNLVGSTQTTSHVETTTQGAASLFSTGLLILVISTIAI